MDIKIIQNQTEVECRPLDESHVLFINREKLSTTIGTGFVPFSRIYFYIYHTQTNIREELLPDVVKYEVADFSFAQKMPYVYYFTVDFENYPNAVFHMMQYNVADTTCKEVYRFEDTLREYALRKQLKVFFLNEDHCIIQTEHLTELKDGYSGFFRFSSSLIDLNTKTAYEIKEERFLQSGLTKVYPIINNICAMRFGISLNIDDFARHFASDEVKKEHLVIVNISQLISDLIIGAEKIDCEIIDTTNTGETFYDVKKQGKYIIYGKHQRADGTDKVIYYQFINKEPTVVLGKPVKDYKLRTRGFILDQRPFVSRYTSKHMEILDVLSAEVLMRFPLTSRILDVSGKYLLIKLKKQVLFKEQTSYELFLYPDFTLVSRLRCDQVRMITLNRNELTLIQFDNE